MEAMIRRLKVKSLYFFCIACFGSVFALPSDKDQVMHMVADSADLNQQSHRGIYIGNVEFNQGTSNLRADRAITEGNNQNKLALAIATGTAKQQAHYWTETGPDKPPFHAFADTIKYYPLTHIIELIGNAHIEQGQNSLSAATITYNIQDQHLVSTSQGKTRTTIIFYRIRNYNESIRSPSLKKVF